MSRDAERGRPTFGRINNLTIPHGTFTEVHGDYNMNVHLPQEAGLIALSQAISHGAIHDSAERYPAGRCHPGTRERIIRRILRWINDEHPAGDVLWLYGPAGTGKSAIMQTIAELLRELYMDHYAGSFFFANGKPGRDQGSALFCTLAYQVAIYIPGMREAVNSAMTTDMTLPKKAMDVQLKSLIIEPFLHCRLSLLNSHTRTILIDGLDECQGTDTQRAILKLIANARTVAGVPLRFLIASRPEYWIRDTFDRYPLVDMTQREDLNDTFYTFEASRDIKKYLEDGFAEIYNKNSDVMTIAERPWPPTTVLDRLVHDASGQFVHASTILKFVGTELCDPQTQLDIILTPGPSRASAFSDLDQLYTKILSVYPRRAVLIRVLGGLVMDIGPLIAIEKCLCVDRRELNMVLRAISSLVMRREYKVDRWNERLESAFETSCPDIGISFCHLSVREYLLDKNRSGEFAVNLQLLGDELFDRGFDFIIGSFQEARRHRDLPVVCNETFRVLGPATQWTSSTKIEHRVKDLQLSIQEFITCNNGTVIQPKLFLRRLTCAQNALDNITYFWEDSFPVSVLDDIQDDIEVIAKEYLRQVLPLSTFLECKNVPYFMAFFYFGIQASDLLGVSQELEEAFLIDNAHLLEPEFDLYRESSVGPMFCPNDNLTRFLRHASIGGIFHSRFRTQTLRCLLTFLDVNPQEVSVSALRDGNKDLHDDNRPPKVTNIYFQFFLEDFLRNFDVSDDKLAEDKEDMRTLVNYLCTNDDWIELKGELACAVLNKLDYGCIAIKWFHRQLNQKPPPPLINDFREKMLNTMGQIYKHLVLPKYSWGYFSNDASIAKIRLSSAAIPPVDQNLSWTPNDRIPPYNVRPLVIPEFSLTPFVPGQVLSEITAMVEEVLPCPLVDLPKCYTRFLQYHLIAYATYFHSCLKESASFSPEFLAYRPKFFALYFSHACSSKKIVIGLWTLRYLCHRMTTRWVAPDGFRSGAIGYLERHAFDSTGDLRLWLDDLTCMPD